MIIECESCSTRFKVPDDRVTDSGTKVRCSKCSHVFVVTPTSGVDAPAKKKTLQFHAGAVAEAAGLDGHLQKRVTETFDAPPAKETQRVRAFQAPDPFAAPPSANIGSDFKSSPPTPALSPTIDPFDSTNLPATANDPHSGSLAAAPVRNDPATGMFGDVSDPFVSSAPAASAGASRLSAPDPFGSSPPQPADLFGRTPDPFASTGSGPAPAADPFAPSGSGPAPAADPFASPGSGPTAAADPFSPSGSGPTPPSPPPSSGPTATAPGAQDPFGSSPKSPDPFGAIPQSPGQADPFGGPVSDPFGGDQGDDPFGPPVGGVDSPSSPPMGADPFGAVNQTIGAAEAFGSESGPPAAANPPSPPIDAKGALDGLFDDEPGPTPPKLPAAEAATTDPFDAAESFDDVDLDAFDGPPPPKSGDDPPRQDFQAETKIYSIPTELREASMPGIETPSPEALKNIPTTKGTPSTFIPRVFSFVWQSVVLVAFLFAAVVWARGGSVGDVLEGRTFDVVWRGNQSVVASSAMSVADVQVALRPTTQVGDLVVVTGRVINQTKNPVRGVAVTVLFDESKNGTDAASVGPFIGWAGGDLDAIQVERAPNVAALQSMSRNPVAVTIAPGASAPFVVLAPGAKDGAVARVTAEPRSVALPVVTPTPDPVEPKRKRRRKRSSGTTPTSATRK